MSESMIDRVARIIDPDAFADGRHGPECEDCEWLRRLAREKGRAVLKELREPTDGLRNTYFALSRNTDVFHDAHWQRAIDAILQEQTS